MANIRITDETLGRFKSLADGRGGDFFVNKLLDVYETSSSTSVEAPKTIPVSYSTAYSARMEPTPKGFQEYEILSGEVISHLYEDNIIELDLENIFGDGLWENEILDRMRVQVRGKELGYMAFGKWEKIGVIL